MTPKSNLSFSNRVARAAWGIFWMLLFRTSPKPLFLWRTAILRLFGAKVGKGCLIYPSARIFAPWNLILEDFVTIGPHTDIYSVDTITLKENSVVSQYAYLCTASHDISYQHQMPLTTAPITLEKHSWATASVYIGPGVTIGEGSVAAARAVVIKDVAPWTIVGGNPAKEIKKRHIKNLT